MKPQRVLLNAVGSSAVIRMDVNKNPFAVGLGVKTSGTVTYTVQHTFDDVWAAGFNPATAKWFDHPTLKTLSADGDSNYAFPVTGIRLTVSAATAATAELTVIQAG